MFTILLISHVSLMICSIGLTIGLVGASALGKKHNDKLSRFNIGATFAGVASGLVLLVSQPLGVRCVMLSAYLVAFSLAYWFIDSRQRSLASQS